MIWLAAVVFGVLLEHARAWVWGRWRERDSVCRQIEYHRALSRVSRREAP